MTVLRMTVVMLAVGAVALNTAGSMHGAQDAGDREPVFELMQPELFSANGGMPNAWADVDNDGDLDEFVGFRGRPNRLYRQERGRFTDVAAAAGMADNVETRAAAWGDFDADGHVDLYVGFVDGTPNRLYRNDGNGRHFTDVAHQFGLDLVGVSRQVSWIDYDNDGDLDLFVANQNGDINGLFRNDAGHFVDVARAFGVEAPRASEEFGGVGPAVADFDGDGVFDLFVANYGPSALYRNDRGQRFVDVTRVAGLLFDQHATTPAWGDYDNDGRTDLYVAGFLATETHYPDHLFHNAPGSFVDALPDLVKGHDASHGVQWVDFDNDGALDLSLTNNDARGGHYLLRNRLAAALARQSLSIDVVDARGRHTRSGAEVRVYAAGTRRLLSSGLVDSGGGYCSQNVMPVHVAAPGGRVDVEVTTMSANGRRVTKRLSVDPKTAPRPLVIRP